jgi:excisionase family DNA binding protein
LLRKRLNPSAAQERGFSLYIDGKENLASRVRHDLILSVVPALTKIQKLAESALLERTEVVSMKRAMSLSPSTVRSTTDTIGSSTDDRPWSVRQAARFLGVSAQTLYLWVARRQIPHLRIMGRNIRFLRADLERFRATFRQDPREM